MRIAAYIDGLLKHRYKIIALWLSVLLLAAVVILMRLFTATTIVDNSVGVWFDLKDPEISEYERYNNSFGRKEWTILVLKTQSIYDVAFLDELDQITQKIAQLDHVQKVTSITNVRDNWTNVEDELDYRRLYPDKNDDEVLDLEKFKQQLAANPIFDKNLINREDDTFTAVVIQNDNFLNDPSPYRTELVNGIENIVKHYPAIQDWGLAGTTVVNAELNKASQRDVIVFYLLVSLLLTIICWLILRSIKDLLVVFSVVVSSVLIAMATLALLEIPYNMATVMLPPLLIALPVAGVLHLITDFHMSHETRSARDTIVNIFKVLWVPSWWAALTTIAGLASFGLSDIAPFYQFGLLGALGVLTALLVNLTIVPILLYIFWDSEKKDLSKHSAFSISLQTREKLQQPWLSLFIVLALSVLMAGLKDVEVDTDYSRFFDKNTRISHSYDLLKEAGMGQNPIILHLTYPTDKNYIEPVNFGATLDFEQALLSLPEVIKVLSISDLVDQLDKAYSGQHQKTADKSRLKGYNRKQLAQLFLLGEISGNDDIDDLALKSHDEIQLVVMTAYLSSKELHTLRQEIALLKKKYLSGNITLNVTGTTVLWANMDTQIITTQFYTLLLVIIFLIVLLPLLFKSVFLGIFGVIINVVPLAATIGLMAWLGIKINIATVIIGAITIGIVVDDTIHMLYRIQKYREQGLSLRDAIDKALTTIGTSIYRTTIILFVAFLSMASSDFLPTAHFGIFVSFSVVLALLLDLIVAPTALKFWAKRQKPMPVRQAK